MKARSARFAGTVLAATLILQLLLCTVLARNSLAVTVRPQIAPMGEASSDAFGGSVSSAGDVNGDGYDDVIVGADRNDAGGEATGRAYVYYGGPAADEVADLVFTGEAAFDHFGYAVASAGDVNDDGYDDVIVGADDNDLGGNLAGRAYVYFGGPSPDTTADLFLTGAVADYHLGTSVSSAGDVNGDGYDDVIVGARGSDSTGLDTGRAYVFFGGISPDSTADLVLTGEAAGDRFGRSVSSAGDVNTDGYDDVIVGGPTNDTAGIDAGRAYVYFGGPTADTVADLILTGEVAGDQFGISVSSAGDVDGDGFDDIIVGSNWNDAGGSRAGRAYVFHGGSAPDATADLVMTGEAADDFFGERVSSAGDVDQDGYDDVIVGAEGSDANGSAAGRAYVFLGGPDTDTTADIVLDGEAASDRFGSSVSGAGDFDGDGFDDLIVGARLRSNASMGLSQAGGANVFTVFSYHLLAPNGGESWTAGGPATVRWQGIDIADIDLSTDGGATWSTLASGVGGDYENSLSVMAPATPTEFALIRVRYQGQAAQSTSDASDSPFRIVLPGPIPTVAARLQFAPSGESPNDYLASTVSSAGDVNGDGYDDVIVGAPRNNAGGSDAGRAYIYHGGPSADVTADLVLTGEAAGDNFGISVSSAGDVDGDGYDDVIVGSNWNDAGGNNAGRAHVFLGGPSGDAVADLVFTGEAADDQFGIAVSSAGDVNGDGYSDLIVGAYVNDAGGSSAGRAYVFFGGPVADLVADLVFTGAEAGDDFGVSVSSAGDVNGDGYDDVIVGAVFAGMITTGKAYVFFGGPSADATADLVLTGEAEFDLFGTSVSTAGDMNGDGYDDLIVGARENDAGGNAAGRAYVYYGGPSVDTTADIIFTGEAAVDGLGFSVSSAGDVNADGYDDVIVGAPGANFLFGRAFVFFGGPSANTIVDLAFTGEEFNDQLGVSVSSAGDVNGDGFDDLMVGAPNADINAGRAYVYDCNRYHVQSPSGGDTWNVGATRTISWLGAEPADVWLSVDGGTQYDPLRTGVGGEETNSMALLVPHTPTRFANLKLTASDLSLAGSARSDSLFTIQSSIALLLFETVPQAEGSAGVLLSWRTDPGPEDIAGYRLEKKPVALDAGSWQTVIALTKETSYRDSKAAAGTRYRLTAVNGLGGEYVLGETSFGSAQLLAAWPLPYPGGELTVSFATASAPGGGPARAEVMLYDVRGRRVRTLARRDYSAGIQSLIWDGRDESGRPVASGIYLLRVRTAGHTQTMKLGVLR